MAKREEFKKERKEDTDIERKLVCVRRVTKVVKGGRNLSFSAMMVVGDKKGKVGMGTGKASETSVAVEKAFQSAKKHMASVKMVGTTIPHEVLGKFGASSVLLLPAREGTGIIAGGSARAVLELAGFKDIMSKSYGSRNKINTVKATINGLQLLRTKEEIASVRGRNADEI